MSIHLTSSSLLGTWQGNRVGRAHRRGSVELLGALEVGHNELPTKDRDIFVEARKEVGMGICRVPEDVSYGTMSSNTNASNYHKFSRVCSPEMKGQREYIQRFTRRWKYSTPGLNERRATDPMKLSSNLPRLNLNEVNSPRASHAR